MRRSLYSLVVLLLSSMISNAQIIRIDTVKSTYIDKKNKNNSVVGQTEYMYTLGLKLLSVDQFPKILNQTNSTDFITSTLYGLMFKFNNNQLSYRISGNYYKNEDFSFKNECEDCEVAKGRLSDLSLKVGFEKNINYSTIQPYFGIDLGFRRNKFEGLSKNAGAVNYTTNYNVVAEKIGAVIAPLMGVKFNVIQHFTLGIESGIDTFFSYERQEKVYNDTQRTHSFEKNNKMELLVKPVAFLSLQYNFGLVD